MVKKKNIVKNIILVITVLVLMGLIVFFVGRSYGFFQYIKKGETTNVISIKGITVNVIEDDNALNLVNAEPLYDVDGMQLKAFTFSITNNSSRAISYNIKVANDTDKQSACLINEGTQDEAQCPVLTTDNIRYSYKLGNGDWSTPANLGANNNVITSYTINGNETLTYSIKMWIKSDATNAIMNHYFFGELIIQGAQATPSGTYAEPILHGADPVLTNNLVPVTIDNDGVVTKADTKTGWYSYENKNWANAVVLIDNPSQTYDTGDTIDEADIESYFVWIPKYSYKLFNLGNYNALTTLTDNTQPIEIVFGTTNTTNTDTTCVTPTTAGANADGSLCSVGKYITHPAFLAFNTNGFWVGKFETGYTGSAPGNTVNASRIVVKPNTYSWRSITVGNMFQNSLAYMEDENSHMMKNTEWGAVAYLSHSIYGTCTGNSCVDIRVNNNGSYVTGYSAVNAPNVGYNTNGTSLNDGTQINENAAVAPGVSTNAISKPYNTSVGYLASTTQNISGIYDMSGGAWEYVAAYTTGGDYQTNSGFNPANYDSKYFDVYSSTSASGWKNRILGDATGEMGPFQSTKDPDGTNRYKSSWYQDYAYFVNSSNPWFSRGGFWNYGVEAGSFAFNYITGATNSHYSFRVVLAPSGV